MATLPRLPAWVSIPEDDKSGRSTNKSIVALHSAIKIPFGTCQVRGEIFAATFVDGFWYVGVLFGHGEIESFIDVWVDQEPPKTGVTYNTYVGNPAQTADPILAAAIPGYADSLVTTIDGKTISIAYAVFKYSMDQYSSLPEFVAEIEGIVLAGGFSDNAGLIIQHIITNDEYGIGEAVDSASFTALASHCTTTNRHFNGVLESPQEIDSIIKMFELYSGARIFRRGDVWFASPDAAGSAVKTLTKDDYIEDTFQLSLASPANTPTVVIVKFTDTTPVIWKTEKAVYELSGVGSTLPRRELELNYPAITSYGQAYHEAEEACLKAKNASETIRFIAFDDHIDLELGDLFAFTHPDGSTGTYRVAADPTLSGAGRVSVTATSYDASSYTTSNPASPGFSAAPSIVGEYYSSSDLINSRGTFIPKHLFSFNYSGYITGSYPWQGINATLSLVQTTLLEGNMFVTASGGGVMGFTLNNGAGFLGQYPVGEITNIVRFRIRRIAGSGTWDGRIYYENDDHSFDDGYYARIPNFVTNEWTIIEVDMRHLKAGGLDWINSDFIYNVSVRLLSSSVDSVDQFELDWFALGARQVDAYVPPITYDVVVPPPNVPAVNASVGMSGWGSGLFYMDNNSDVLAWKAPYPVIFEGSSWVTGTNSIQLVTNESTKAPDWNEYTTETLKPGTLGPDYEDSFPAGETSAVFTASKSGVLHIYLYACYLPGSTTGTKYNRYVDAYARSVDFGKTWTVIAVELHAYSNNVNQYPWTGPENTYIGIGLSPDGQQIVCLRQIVDLSVSDGTSTGILMMYSSDAGETWSDNSYHSTADIVPVRRGESNIRVKDNGNVYIVGNYLGPWHDANHPDYQEMPSVAFGYTTDNGASWTRTVLEVGDVYGPTTQQEFHTDWSVAWDSSGKPHVVISSIAVSGGAVRVQYYRGTSETAFAAGVSLATDAGGAGDEFKGIQCDICIDGQDNIYVFYIGRIEITSPAAATETGNLYVRKSTNGGTSFSAEEKIVSAKGLLLSEWDDHRAIVDGLGNIHVFWTQHLSSGITSSISELHLMSSDAGSTWYLYRSDGANKNGLFSNGCSGVAGAGATFTNYKNSIFALVHAPAEIPNMDFFIGSWGPNLLKPWDAGAEPASYSIPEAATFKIDSRYASAMAGRRVKVSMYAVSAATTGDEIGLQLLGYPLYIDPNERSSVPEGLALLPFQTQIKSHAVSDVVFEYFSLIADIPNRMVAGDLYIAVWPEAINATIKKMTPLAGLDDDFNRSNGVLDGDAGWVDQTGFPAMVVSSNVARGAGSNAAEHRSASYVDPDFSYVEATISEMPTGSNYLILLAKAAEDGKAYGWRILPNGAVDFYSYDGTSYDNYADHTLGKGTESLLATVGAVIRAEYYYNEHRCFIDGVCVGVYTYGSGDIPYTDPDAYLVGIGSFCSGSTSGAFDDYHDGRFSYGQPITIDHIAITTIEASRESNIKTIDTGTSYALDPDDAFGAVRIDSSSAFAVYIPDGVFPVGVDIKIRAAGSGGVTLTAPGYATLNASGGSISLAQYAEKVITQIDLDVWE